MPPIQRSTSLDQIEFKDFRPGIADDPGVSYPPEMATRTNTYRCISNNAGALVPLPKRTTPFTMPHEIAAPTSIAVSGLYVAPIPVLPNVLAFTANQFPEHEVFVATEWLDGGTHNQTHKWYRVRRYETPGTLFDTLNTKTWGGGLITSFTPHGMTHVSTRSNQTTPTDPGAPVVVGMWTEGASHNFLKEFPDDTNLTSNTPFTIFNDSQFLLHIAAHQGRVVAQQATAYGQGVDTTTFMGENLLWSDVNDVTPANWSTPAQVFVPENPSGFAFLCAMSANELFAVKLYGGMYVTGDLDNPTVVSLPMVTGSELAHTPVVTDMGVVYGNRSSGVWVWPHGDSSVLLSGQLEPDFWVITSGSDFDAFGGVLYQFARCDEWVLVPNNWIFDTTLKSWWRLEDESVARFRFMTSMGHFIYGAESTYTSSDDDPIHEWVREDKAASYSWQSQPIWQSVADIVNVAEIDLVAQGKGTIQLTMTAYDGTTNSITITLANTGRPERFRENFNIQGKYLQVRLVANSGDSTAAPTIFSLALSPFTENPIGHTL